MNNLISNDLSIKYFTPPKVQSLFPFVQAALKHRNHPNLKVIWFEDMKRDLAGVIRDVATFLDRKLSDENVEKLVEHLHIDNFRKITTEMLAGGDAGFQKQMTDFFRKGEIGDWKNHDVDGENNVKWNEWIERSVEGTDIQIKFE